MTTIYVKVVPPGSSPADVPWIPWTVHDRTPREKLERQAIVRFVQDRGGVDSGEPLKLEVLSYDASAPLYPSGNPRTCRRARYTLLQRLLNPGPARR